MSAKRRATNAASPDLPSPNNKRRRTNDVQPQETPESTTEAGLRLMQLLKKCKDSQGRDVATEFLKLPDKRAIPEYYEQIKLPLALDMIEKKLKNRGYPTLEALEGDLKRLIQNARDFNEKGSVIVEDAERLRKAIANFMPKHNPKYSDPNYKAIATPIPGEIERDASVEQDTEPTNGGRRQSLKIKLTNKKATAESPAARTPTPKPAQKPTRRSKDLPSFDGMDFQKAHEMIMQELIDLKDEDGNELSLNFLEKPDKRRYADYYRKIKTPVALYTLQKRARGVVHNRLTGVSLYHSWDDFAADVRLLWNNARVYNEEGSEVYELAGKLEEYFEPRLIEARSKVKDPATLNGDNAPQRIKLKMNASTETPEPQQKLILKHHAPSQTPPATAQSGIGIDGEALKRQQELVRAGSSGDIKTRASEEKQSISVVPLTNGVNGDADAKTNESQTRPTSSGTPMPPPSSAASQTPTTAPVQPAPRPVPHVPTSIFDRRFREDGKDASSALLANVSVSTHPKIKVDHRFHLDIPASSNMTQQSITLTLPQSHYYLRLEVSLTENAKERIAKKVVISRNGQLMPSSAPDPEVPVYEFRLYSGMNIIWVDAIAGPPRDSPKVATVGDATDFERLTIFANLLR